MRLLVLLVGHASANQYVQNAPNKGMWGGQCTCPDGSVYGVGDNGDFCGSLACVFGQSGPCHKSGGAWSFGKVICRSSNHDVPVPTVDGMTSEAGLQMLLDLLGTDGSIAVVGSSGQLLGTGKGAEIDSHRVVVRVNGAPTRGFEHDVGSRTDLRIIWDERLVRMNRYAMIGDEELVLMTCVWYGCKPKSECVNQA